MQGGRGRGRGDPFYDFGGMPMRSLFGGRDPFDDPFFTQPFGGMLHPPPFGHTGTPFGSGLSGPNPSPSMDAPAIYDHTQSIPNSSRAPIIEEVNSDDEEEDPETGGNSMTQYGNQFSAMNNTHSRPQAHTTFTFQSCSVTYGGSDGAYYTSSTTRRAGSDGLRFEEHKEADSVSGEAAHRISRGIHDKGHTVQRHLRSDGQVNTMQTLHNINQDELNGFEEAWRGRGGWALPSTSTESNRHGGGRRRLGAGDHHAQSSKSKRR